jgi:hypothetical protein
LPVNSAGGDDGLDLSPQRREFLVQGGVRIGVQSCLAGLNRLGLHLDKQIFDGFTGVDGDVDD